jgi:Uma2 family endonuclease
MVAPEATKLMTAEELLQLPSSERYELVKGVLVEMAPPPGSEHGSLANQLAYLLTHYIRQHDLGRVFAAETGFRLARNPDTVRAADVAFVSKARCPAKFPKGYLDFAPDLVAEVVSPSDNPDEIQAKIKDWLDAGTQMVLFVYPGSRQVVVYRSLREVTVLTEKDAFSAPDILPGFACSVSDIFA